MALHGHGFLPLALPAVVPLTGDVYSGFGFRSAQGDGLLYYRASPVSSPGPLLPPAVGTGGDPSGWRGVWALAAGSPGHCLQDGFCQVALQGGHVMLHFLRTEVKSPGVFADGASHYVAFYSNTTG